MPCPNGSIGLPRLTDAHQLARSSHLEARNVASILAMVRAGLGVSALPGLWRSADPDICFLPLADLFAERILGWIAPAGRTLQPAATQPLAAVRATIASRVTSFGYELVD